MFARSAFVSANGVPSVRIQPLAVMRSIAFVVEVDSHARYVPARFPACAACWQIASAPARPPMFAPVVVEVTNMRFGGGANVARTVIAAVTGTTHGLVPVQ